VSRLRDWAWLFGSTPEERARAYPCDALLPGHDVELYRGVTVRANAATVFRWLCQLRVAPYSYDWLDNLGRRSPRALTQGAERLEPGQRVMGIFDLVAFERDRHLTLRLRRPGLFPPLVVSYVVDPRDTSECRLLVKLVVRERRGAWDRIGREIFPVLDAIMMRRQLLNLKQLAERAPDLR